MMGRHSAPTSRHRAEVIKTPVAVHLKRAGVVVSGAMALALVGSTAAAPTGTLTALSGAPAQVIWKADPTPHASGQVIGTERTLVRQVSETQPLETEAPAPTTKEVPVATEVEVPPVVETPVTKVVPVVTETEVQVPTTTVPVPTPETTAPAPVPTPEATPPVVIPPVVTTPPEPEKGCTV